MIAVADTTPLNYLVLIHHADLLHQSRARLISSAVFAELRGPGTPPLVHRRGLVDLAAELTALDPALIQSLLEEEATRKKQYR